MKALPIFGHNVSKKGSFKRDFADDRPRQRTSARRSEQPEGRLHFLEKVRSRVLKMMKKDCCDVEHEKRLLALNGGTPEGLELTNGSGSYVLVAVQPDGSGEGRLVKFDKAGLNGHAVYASAMEALRVAVDEGYTEEARGTMSALARTDAWIRRMMTKGMASELAALRPNRSSILSALGLKARE